MARPPHQPRRDDIPAGEQDAYDAVVARQRPFLETLDAAVDDRGVGSDYVGEYWGALLNSPPMCAIAAQMGTFVRTASERSNTYSYADREFVDQVLSADWKTNLVQGLHISDAVGAGVRLEAIKALRYGNEQDLNEDEQLLAAYIRQVVTGTVDDATWERMEQRLGTRGVVEYTGFVLWLQWIMRMMQALQISCPSDDEIDAVIAGLESGQIEVPDHMARIR